MAQIVLRALNSSCQCNDNCAQLWLHVHPKKVRRSIPSYLKDKYGQYWYITRFEHFSCMPYHIQFSHTLCHLQLFIDGDVLYQRQAL